MPRKSRKKHLDRTLRSGLGPGSCNKYRDITATPCFVTMFQPKTVCGKTDGRDIFKGTQNPYQFDKTYLARVQMAADQAAEAYYDTVVQKGRQRLYGEGQSERTLSRSHSLTPEAFYCAFKGIDEDTVGHLDTTMPGYTGYNPGVGPLGIHAITYSKANIMDMPWVQFVVTVMSLQDIEATLLATALLEPDIGATILAALQGPRDPGSSSSDLPVSPSNHLGDEGKRRASKALAEIDTVVMKNLAYDVTKTEIIDTLLRERLPLPPISVEFHLDARGAFRGTVFVKFPTQQSAAACVEAFQPPNNFCRIGGRKIRVELQRKGRRERACSARDVMEASLSMEKQDVVKRLVEGFLADNSQREAFLPSDLDAAQRKYAHAIAEKAGLVHTTQPSPDSNSTFDDGLNSFVDSSARSPKRAVFLSKFRVSSGRSSSKNNKSNRKSSEISFSMDFDNEDFSPNSFKSAYSGSGSLVGQQSSYAFGHASTTSSSALFHSASSNQGDGLLPLPLTPPINSNAGGAILGTPPQHTTGLTDMSLSDSRTLKFTGSPIRASPKARPLPTPTAPQRPPPSVEAPPPGFEHIYSSGRGLPLPGGHHGCGSDIDESVLAAHIANINKNLVGGGGGGVTMGRQQFSRPDNSKGFKNNKRPNKGRRKFNRDCPEFIPSQHLPVLGMTEAMSPVEPSAEAATTVAINESIEKLLDA
ncbi:hypothetical protein FOL47_009723 [Perkinsus chesapeaki]|uniref:RRM domain-containing protein n=1 Tax=Perkinsus chesapeaki TaxID=330153 RepID=A0A7J6N1Q4_PERCH|nr:hypothetical protein FOL47_009723 [Perkinsus chesapeaki]